MLLLPPRRRGGVSGSSDGGGFIHWPGFTPPGGDKDDGDTPGGGKDDDTPPVPDDPDDDNDNDNGDKEPAWPETGATYIANNGKGSTYTRTENGVELTKVATNTPKILEQVELDGVTYKITGFGRDAFDNLSLTRISVPASLCNTESGLNAALLNKSYVKEIEIRSSFFGYTISESAFQDNTTITSVYLIATENIREGETGVTKIEKNAFNGCTSLTTIWLTSDRRDGLTIEAEAFSGCEKLESKGVYYIDSQEDWNKWVDEGKISSESGLPESAGFQYNHT